MGSRLQVVSEPACSPESRDGQPRRPRRAARGHEVSRAAREARSTRATAFGTRTVDSVRSFAAKAAVKRDLQDIAPERVRVPGRFCPYSRWLILDLTMRTISKTREFKGEAELYELTTGNSLQSVYATAICYERITLVH